MVGYFWILTLTRYLFGSFDTISNFLNIHSIRSSSVVGSKGWGSLAGSCNFRTDSCKFLTEKIWASTSIFDTGLFMGIQNFNVVTKFPQNCGFPAPKCVVLEHNFLPKRKFLDRLKFELWLIHPFAVSPPRRFAPGLFAPVRGIDDDRNSMPTTFF